MTGGASGIGRALCRRFAADGARGVVVADRDGDGAVAVAQEIGAGAVAVAVDPSRKKSRRWSPGRKHVDLMFSNAGIGTGGGVDVSDEGWQNIWEINVMSHIYAARAVLPKMIERGEGYIASTSSAAGLLSQIGSAPYAVTKHAAVALAEWIAITHGNEGIRVSVLCPQAVRTADRGRPGRGRRRRDDGGRRGRGDRCAGNRTGTLPHPAASPGPGVHATKDRGLRPLAQRHEATPGSVLAGA